MTNPSDAPSELLPRGRYMACYCISLAAYCLALPAVVIWGPFTQASEIARVLLATAPALPLFVCMATLGLGLRAEPDEFQRLMRAEAMLWASGLTIGGLTVVGFLGLFGVLTVSPFVLTLVFPAWTAVAVTAKALIGQRYR